MKIYYVKEVVLEDDDFQANISSLSTNKEDAVKEFQQLLNDMQKDSFVKDEMEDSDLIWKYSVRYVPDCVYSYSNTATNNFYLLEVCEGKCNVTNQPKE